MRRILTGRELTLVGLVSWLLAPTRSSRTAAAGAKWLVLCSKLLLDGREGLETTDTMIASAVGRYDCGGGGITCSRVLLICGYTVQFASQPR
jgi:hypothetical protein